MEISVSIKKIQNDNASAFTEKISRMILSDEFNNVVQWVMKTDETNISNAFVQMFKQSCKCGYIEVVEQLLDNIETLNNKKMVENGFRIAFQNDQLELVKWFSNNDFGKKYINECNR